MRGKLFSWGHGSPLFLQSEPLIVPIVNIMKVRAIRS